VWRTTEGSPAGLVEAWKALRASRVAERRNPGGKRPSAGHLAGPREWPDPRGIRSATALAPVTPPEPATKRASAAVTWARRDRAPSQCREPIVSRCPLLPQRGLFSGCFASPSAAMLPLNLPESQKLQSASTWPCAPVVAPLLSIANVPKPKMLIGVVHASFDGGGTVSFKFSEKVPLVDLHVRQVTYAGGRASRAPRALRLAAVRLLLSSTPHSSGPPEALSGTSESIRSPLCESSQSGCHAINRALRVRPEMLAPHSATQGGALNHPSDFRRGP